MPPRLPHQRVHSFISFYSCSRLHPPSRAFATCMRGRSPAQCSQLSTNLRGPRRESAFHSSAPRRAPKDPYQTLGVKKDATAAEIKKIYFSLARKYHPDTNPDTGAKEKFVEIQEAYDLLKDDKKRAAYDKYGAASQQPGFNPDAFENARNPFGGSGGFSGFQDFSAAFGSGGRGHGDLFEQFFGGAFGRSRGAGFTENLRGNDIEVSIGISFMEACKGASRTINISPIVNCGTCSGTGLKAGAKRSTCTHCGGTGTKTFVIDSGFQMASTCASCQGTGTTVPRGSQCGTCAGVGQVRTRKSVKVDIPAGVEDGMAVRIPGAGDAPISGKGQNGDLQVRVNVSSSKLFRRQGVNLHHEARIPLHTALLGGRVRVPTLDGEVDVRVPGGTQQGEEMVLKGHGVLPVFGGDKGDLFVTFSVQLPRSLTKRQREILQQYADDVEGRATSPPQPEKPSFDHSGRTENLENPAKNTKNGTDSSTPPDTHPREENGRLSRAWKGFRRLIDKRGAEEHTTTTTKDEERDQRRRAAA